MSSVADSSEFSTLIDELQRHSTQSKLLQKVLDDTRHVLREIRVASCISQSTYCTVKGTHTRGGQKVLSLTHLNER